MFFRCGGRNGINKNMEKRLNLGSGDYKKEGFINLDWNQANNPDVIHDLNKFPYPFPDSFFDCIEALHVLEHLDRPFFVMKELHRILKPGGKLLIKVPHFSRGFTHAEHSHGFDITFPMYFDARLGRFLSGFRGFEFKLEKMELRWLASLRILSKIGYGKIAIIILRIADKIISFLANLNSAFCSRIWCYWFGGFEEIEFKFIALK